MYHLAFLHKGTWYLYASLREGFRSQLSAATLLMLQRLVGKGAMHLAVAELEYTYLIAGTDFALFDDPAEDAFAGEDAVAGKIVDSATRMADFSDLRHFDGSRAHTQ